MKKHSKIISLILVISLLAGLFCLPAHAVDTPYEDSLFYTQGDYEIHYRIVEHKGEFRGRIMMLHGFMCSTYAWRNMAANLSEAGYDCVMADLPNFGYSTRETENTRVIDREELIAGLMKSIAPAEEWILAGHSMGGGVAANIAEELPVSRQRHRFLRRFGRRWGRLWPWGCVGGCIRGIGQGRSRNRASRRSC